MKRSREQLLTYMRTKTRLIDLHTEANQLFDKHMEEYLVTGDKFSHMMSRSYLMCSNYLKERIGAMQ